MKTNVPHQYLPKQNKKKSDGLADNAKTYLN